VCGLRTPNVRTVRVANDEWRRWRSRRRRRRCRRHRRRKIVRAATEVHSWCGCGKPVARRGRQDAFDPVRAINRRDVRRGGGYGARPFGLRRERVLRETVFINGRPDPCACVVFGGAGLSMLDRYARTHVINKQQKNNFKRKKKKGFTGNYNASGLNVPIIMYIHHPQRVYIHIYIHAYAFVIETHIGAIVVIIYFTLPCYYNIIIIYIMCVCVCVCACMRESRLVSIRSSFRSRRPTRTTTNTATIIITASRD